MSWVVATVVGVTHPTPTTVRLRLDVPDRAAHLPGQHYVVRLEADDGYVAQRSYSVASAPSDPLLELLVERLEDGEVSTWFADVARPGDTFEVRGPIGGWFAWDGTAPALGIGGGTGVVPLVAMTRHAVGIGQSFTVVAAARTLAELPYAGELAATGATIALSRAAYRGRPAARLTTGDLPEPDDRTVFVCGSSGFAETATSLLVEKGWLASRIRVERFGASGS